MPEDRCDALVQRHRRVDLGVGDGPQQRLDLHRRGQQNNVIELRMELRPILLASRDKEHLSIFGGKECADRFRSTRADCSRKLVI
jgi:hypothetical protein